MRQIKRAVYNNEYLLNTNELANKIKHRSYELMGEIKGKKILDLGCGNGMDVIQIANFMKEYNKIFGVDKDKNILNRAEQNLSNTNLENIQFVEANAENLPFENGYFDTIRIERVFQHLTNIPKVLKEINRVLKWNGQLVILETDWASLSMFTEDYDLERKIIDHLVHKFTNNGLASRQLIQFLNLTNFKQTSTEILSSSINSYDIANRLIKIEEIGKEVVKEGSVKKDSYEKWLRDVYQNDLKKNFNCNLNMMIISTHKI